MSELVVVRVAGQRAAIPVTIVRSAIGPQPVRPVPRAHPIVAGVLNLRGRVITAIDLERCLGIPRPPNSGERSALVVELDDGNQYALLVDGIDEIAELEVRVAEPGQIARLLPGWEQVVPAVHDTPEGIVVQLDVRRLLEPAFGPARAA
jgi:purine-binding chemotaxis protein CheW